MSTLKTLAIGAILLIATPAQARFFFTLPQCQKYYGSEGQALSRNQHAFYLEDRRYIVVCRFDRLGRCDAIRCELFNFPAELTRAEAKWLITQTGGKTGITDENRRQVIVSN